MKHKMRDGRDVDIQDMTDAHLINTIRLLKRRAIQGVKIRYGQGGSGDDDMWYDEDSATGNCALDALNYSEYASEASRRGLAEL